MTERLNVDKWFSNRIANEDEKNEWKRKKVGKKKETAFKHYFPTCVVSDKMEIPVKVLTFFTIKL